MSIRKHAMLLAATASLATAGCTTNPETGNREISKTAIGAVLGAGAGFLAGDVLGGKSDRTAKIVGAGVGAIAGGAIGNYMDRQEKELREKTAGTGVDVVRDGDNLQLTVPSLTFASNSTVVQPQFQSTLAQVAQTLANYDKTFVDVMGHTDSDGADAFNQDLSERRASSVANVLANSGVVRARIATKGFGETQPVADNSTVAGKAQNRRVEIKLVPVTEQDVRATS